MSINASIEFLSNAVVIVVKMIVYMQCANVRVFNEFFCMYDPKTLPKV